MHFANKQRLVVLSQKVIKLSFLEMFPNSGMICLSLQDQQNLEESAKDTSLLSTSDPIIHAPISISFPLLYPLKLYVYI